MKRALITGITGQDGSYLAELLLTKGYEVHGIIRRASSFNTSRIEHLYQDPHEPGARLFLHYGDLTDSASIERVVRTVLPDEVYHLGAQSHVRSSFDMPLYTADTVAMSTQRLLESLRSLLQTKSVRYYQASSSEMYGNATEVPQRESTPFAPRSPYGCSKAMAHWLTVNYREAYGLHASNGILFNHESPRRGETFVTRKITRGVARILSGKDKKLFLGNLEARRDWGYAKDYVEAMWLMLQQPQGDDFVIATGELRRVADFLEEAFGLVGKQWREYVEIDSRYFRPTEVDSSVGDASKAHAKLGWRPKTSFKNLVEIMVREDLEREGLKSTDWIKT